MQHDDGSDAAPTSAAPLGVLSELVGSIPRLVDRTRSQAEFARAVASHLPCLTAVRRVAGADGEFPPGDGIGAVDLPEPVDVLSLLDDEHPTVRSSAGATSPAPSSPVSGAPGPNRPGPAVEELPVPGYDSLAASQVVPRLATLSADELRVVQSYETGHRNRQTILNRVAQLLDG